MALYQLKISYDGTDFHGYQRQKDHRTIQGEIESALRRIGWSGKSIVSSGRTDTGVHAEGQIATVEFEWKHSNDDLKRAVNSELPLDVSIIETLLAQNEGFNPRFDATSRKYRYQIYTRDVNLPTHERYYWRVWQKPDFDMMNDAAERLLGRHDFKRFGKPYKSGGRTERIVISAKWEMEDENRANFQIVANSFLYHMVRRIVYVTMLVGQGKVTIKNVADELEGFDNLPPGIAPAKGLFLERIFY